MERLRRFEFGGAGFCGRVDSVLARRVSAVGLLVVAAVVAVRGDPGEQRTEVVVAARELPPGHVLAEGDLRRVPRETDALPAGAVRESDRLRGATLSGAVAEGEIVTELRVVGPRLAAVAAGVADGRIVPIRLADNAVADVLRAGDRVDVVAFDEGGNGGRGARLLVSDAAVVLAPGDGGARGREGAGERERVVLVAMDARHATVVAAASLRSALTVVFH
ncbi:SAF domain-containing protein [Nocardia sp. NPDC127526]|uniref:SAF domain-containing protein n=1 Tax=Nocardia sp. NPDC127526 TaxID=3345393 RepID=UPI0036398665